MTIQVYEEERDRAYQVMIRGDLKAAARGYERARELARELADPELLDAAEVNLAMIRVQMHEDELAERGLREVLLRTASDDVIRLASHCLAKILSHRNQHEKALRFATTSLEKAEAIGDPLLRYSAQQLMGAVQANQSRLDEALTHYAQALDIIEAHPLPDEMTQAFHWSAATDMHGYVLLLLGRVEEGREQVERAHARASEYDLRDLIAESAADLCFAYLLEERLEEARTVGEQCLAISEKDGLDFHRRNAYYLLGEVCSRLGLDREANGYYRKLGEFYPQIPFLEEFLRDYDISSMINLKEFA